MSHVFHRSARSVPPLALSAEGSFILGADGRRYLDACGGAAVSCIGHGRDEVAEAIAAQARGLAYAHTGFFTSAPAEELADLLVAGAPAGIDKVYFVLSGSEAVETALKMAHQYHRERGEPARRHVISRWQSYHGNTLGALAAGGNRGRRTAYQDLLVEMHHIPPCYPYRGMAQGESAEEYGRRAADDLERAILDIGPETVSAFIAETVVGATLGAVAPAPGYFSRIREICDRYGVLLILDEVMCGMGRTGHLHACLAEGVAPDVMTLAKGLGAGYLPLGAVLVSGRVHQAFADGSGGFLHGQTFCGHPVACAGALATQTIVRREGLVECVRAEEPFLEGLLRDAFAQHPHVGDIRGRGYFWALELVEDRDSKAPFPAGARLAARVKAEAQQLGLLCYPGSGTVDGQVGDHVLLAPPYTATRGELEQMVSLLGETFDTVFD
ncbi:aspartate aminotransferase family protein [Microbaculum marinisediminis]|uniref:Aspartate aminotransferase family protein n=1 Tax=Microbaculum marinisediminis TaxID=2931392 RepID=A0AAW5R0H9_9HYPH|nr:aspartate aminotransferase family protein [Microbaculum sp. A6E488]MCT8973776.1 aspartate aminotransferase family protein [Microbaculum sp. A6E488]